MKAQVTLMKKGKTKGERRMAKIVIQEARAEAIEQINQITIVQRVPSLQKEDKTLEEIRSPKINGSVKSQ